MLSNYSLPVNRKQTFRFKDVDAFGNDILTTDPVTFTLVSADAGSVEDDGVIAISRVSDDTVQVTGLKVGGPQRLRGTLGAFSADVMVTTIAPIVTDARFIPGTESNV